ncbi:hypothetical protein CathTA2_2884 [Caldalkalibacillus thermarum TA2.A1]|uniref:Uncharacterized protein n=1 Tax=Caldalkalibacillus thermarum (strain TA2.A1) TaxID=986075 RepID=F5LAE9_CALTT|nr:hypothetical protein [Caldalkalibacillus thermarum]EGL81698.1 hypothetical protein CathTA2_2884 [Caldalkalibacillus thermarum TA2.A1]QZT33286.1 hypothetical protein HUR95_13485 [Caldalkalibacillus thermarum TA2.A1]
MDQLEQSLKCERLQTDNIHPLTEGNGTGVGLRDWKWLLQAVINRTVQQYIARPQNRHTGLMCLHIFGTEYKKAGLEPNQSALSAKLPVLIRRLLESLCYVLWSQDHQNLLMIKGIVGQETLTPAGKKQYHFYIADDTLINLEELYHQVYSPNKEGNQKESEIVVHFLLEDRKVLLKHRP